MPDETHTQDDDMPIMEGGEHPSCDDQDASEEGPSAMSFGEHLEELRRHVIRAAVGLVLVFIVLFFFRERVIQIVVHPVEMALAEVQQKQIKKAPPGQPPAGRPVDRYHLRKRNRKRPLAPTRPAPAPAAARPFLPQPA